MKNFINDKVSWLEDGNVVHGTVVWQKLMLTVVRDDNGCHAYVNSKDATVEPVPVAEGTPEAGN